MGQVMDTNVTGVFLMCRSFRPGYLKAAERPESST